MLTTLNMSPEQISNRLEHENSKIRISVNTIYRGIERNEIRDTVKPYLRKKYRGNRSHSGENNRGKLVGAVSITERPEAAAQRSEIGHWEADTVVGPKKSGCILTLVDRCSRYLLAKRLKSSKAEDVTKGIIELLKSVPKKYVLSVTPDCGKEFFGYKTVTETLGVPFYFCHPGSPWERPTNENTNGLLRQYFPKGFSFERYFDDEFLRAFALINIRPRKCLNWFSPIEIFYGTSLHLT